MGKYIKDKNIFITTLGRPSDPIKKGNNGEGFGTCNIKIASLVFGINCEKYRLIGRATEKNNYENKYLLLHTRIGTLLTYLTPEREFLYGTRKEFESKTGLEIFKFGEDISTDISKIEDAQGKFYYPNIHILERLYELDGEDGLEKYSKEARNKTRKNVKNAKCLADILKWDGLDFYDKKFIGNNWGPDFKENQITIDHKISIWEGFIRGYSTNSIADIRNLVLTTKSNNSSKNKSNYIEYIERYEEVA